MCHEQRERARPNNRTRQRPRRSRQKHKQQPVRKEPKPATAENVFSRQMWVQTHTRRYIVNGRARTHTLSLRKSRARARPLAHTDTGSSECGSLGLYSPSSVRKQSRSLLCSPTASARRKKPTKHKQLICFSTPALVCAVKK